MGDVEIEAELQAYLAEHNVEHLLKDIVVKLCLDKPKDPVSYLKKFFADLESKNKAAAPADGDEEEDGEPKKARRQTRRGGVSADVIDDDDAATYQKKIVPKDASTMLQLQKCVNGNVLFTHLEQDELTDVLDCMFQVKKPAGEVIMAQGDDGDNFYCIDKGVVEVWIAKDGEPAEKFSEIADGGSFGELALIYGTPRAATIKSKTDVVLWAIDRDSYRRILMGSVIRKRKMYEEFLEKVPLLSSLDKWERLAVADALEPATYKSGDVVMRQGASPEDGFYVIIDGKATVQITNDKGENNVVNELAAGQYFGLSINVAINLPFTFYRRDGYS